MFFFEFFKFNILNCLRCLDTFSGNVGLAISQALILTGMVQYGVRQAADTMQQMTCVERIMEYTNLKPVLIIFTTNVLLLFHAL